MKLSYFNNELKRDVQYSASGQKILEIMCGSQPDGCNPERFVEYLGNNPQSPFIFNMNITNQSYNALDHDTGAVIAIKPVNTTLHSCASNIDMAWYQAPACGCSDCQDSCPMPVPPPQDKKCLIYGIDCLGVIMTGVFVLISTSFLIGLLINNARLNKRRGEDSEIQREGNLQICL